MKTYTKASALALASLILATPMTGHSISDKAKTELEKGLSNYQSTISLTSSGMTPSTLTEYLKTMRIYNLDTIKVGGQSGGKVVVYPKYFESKEELREVKRFASVVAAEVEGLNAHEKVYYITQRVGNLLSYNSSKEEGSTSIFSPYAGLSTGEGVCQAYARLMDILLKEAGINTSFIEGTLDGVPHLWNIVQINSEWYGVDATSADTDEGKIDFSYVFMNLKEMKDRGYITLFTKAQISWGNIKKFSDVGSISTKTKKFYSLMEEGMLSVDYSTGSKVRVIEVEAEDFYIVGGDVMVLNKGTLKSPEGKIYANNVVREDIKNTGTELIIAGTLTHTPITVVPNKVRLVTGDFKVTIEEGPDKVNYLIKTSMGRTNVFYKDKLVLQVMKMD